MIKIKEMYIEGNRIVFVGEDESEYALGYEGLDGGIDECEVIIFTKTDKPTEV